MFTGLVEEVGTVAAVTRAAFGIDLAVSCRQVREELAVGDSIAVDGVCLTVTAVLPGGFAAQAVAETLVRTTLGSFFPGRAVNLERALRAQDRLGGHIVQGHVDGVAEVADVTVRGQGKVMAVAVPEHGRWLLVPKGSVAIDGVSLTVAHLEDKVMEIWLVPHTLARTTLGQKKPGDMVNIEVDILAKYAARMLHAEEQAGLSVEKLKGWGY